MEFHGPTVSNIVILGAFACFTALGVVFLYRHLSKKRRRKEARLLQAGRVDLETGTVGTATVQHRQTMSPRWRVREEWANASIEDRDGIMKYKLVMGPDSAFPSFDVHPQRQEEDNAP